MSRFRFSLKWLPSASFSAARGRVLFHLLDTCSNRSVSLEADRLSGQGRRAGETGNYLLVQLDILQHLDGLVVISQQGVQTQEPHQAEVAKHLVQGVPSVFPSHALGVT